MVFKLGKNTCTVLLFIQQKKVKMQKQCVKNWVHTIIQYLVELLLEVIVFFVTLSVFDIAMEAFWSTLLHVASVHKDLWAFSSLNPIQSPARHMGEKKLR